MIVTGIAGPAGSGKDEVADAIVRLNPKYSKDSFAAPLKDMLRIGLSLSEEQISGGLKETVSPVYGRSPRNMMQTLGTDWGRQLVGDDVWLRAFDRRLKGNTVVSDVRFENEAAYVREHGVLIHVVRPRDLNTTAMGDNSSHVSESGIERHASDYVIQNDGTKDQLYAKVAAMLQHFRSEWGNWDA